MFVMREAWRAGLLAPQHWLSNIIAGVIVGVVALPLAMAFAIASGVKPEQGIYTAIIAGLAVSVLGGSRVQIAGPTGAFIVILSGIVAQHGVDGLQIATLMAGIILFFFGVARMGAVIRYIPAPVIIGFTAGIGVIIWVGQWQDFFGLPVASGQYFHQKFWALLQVFPQLDPATTLLGLLSLALVVGVHHIPYCQRVPGPLLALIVVTLIQGVFQFEHVATIGSTFGEIPRGLPSFVWPQMSLDRVLSLVGPAFAIAMLGAIESLLSAVVADSMAGTRHDSNQELIGQGIANVLSPLFGGIAATGAIARTATNIRNGGTSPLAGIVHVLTLVLVLILLAPLAKNIPLATLAAVLFVVAWNMSEAPRFIRLVRRAPRADVVILLVTFGLTVFADLVVAVNIGVVLAVLHFLRRTADSVEVHAETEAQLQREFMYAGFTNLPTGVEVYRLDGPFFFAAIERFRHSLEGSRAPVLILRMDHVPFVDATALQSLDEAAQVLQARGVRVMITGANALVTRKLDRMGLRERLGRDNLQHEFMQAIAVLRDAAPSQPVAP
ncbi:STAS domain-containing protein [Alcaligenaceae bacterium CGII-47]|nr:STAS domain-containing protein [Alcaligenaceae bacterium CGII-47]